MKTGFREPETLVKLKHFLPSQAPLRDFIHHNSLHAFQELNFFTAARQSAHVFGTRTLLTLTEFRAKFREGSIAENSVDFVLQDVPEIERISWRAKMFEMNEPEFWEARIGRLRKYWKKDYKVDLDGLIWPKLVRLVNAYLDQGIAFHPFPEAEQGLLHAVNHIQHHSQVKIFRSKRVIELLNKKEKAIAELLHIIVGDEHYFEQYLFDQQFGHPGISGMASTIEERSDSLFAYRPITLFDLIYLELLFELEVLEKLKGTDFIPLTQNADFEPVDLFEQEPTSDYWKVLELWQEAFEWTYHDQVLRGIKSVSDKEILPIVTQAFFCIDDRSESIRRNIEYTYPQCQTFGSPGHFFINAKFKPFGAKFSTQVCPAAIKPTHLIKENDRSERQKKDIHFQRYTHRFLSGFVISQTIGIWSSFKLLSNIFFPKESPAEYDARHDHMDFKASLKYEQVNNEFEEGLSVGYSVQEMAEIVLAQLTSVGLTENFSKLIYFFGHGGSSTNNPYFAGYNCGACSGRPGSLNARVFALMANQKEVREYLRNRGVNIPDGIHFIGGYHDTTQDTFDYFDEDRIPDPLRDLHNSNRAKFVDALHLNAKERARQFQTINIKKPAKKVHREVVRRSYALFEPRPEYNHSNNAIFVVGNRALTQNLYLDQRAFLSSYDHATDPEGDWLKSILNAGTGVCGGINLEYFFSLVDNQKFGAGSKLPQNIFGLYGVANGVKGDLRPGLPWQMIDVHDPIRLLTIVEQDPHVVMRVIHSNKSILQWFANQWIKLAVYDPASNEIFLYKNGEFQRYEPYTSSIQKIQDMEKLIESTSKNLPVYQLK